MQSIVRAEAPRLVSKPSISSIHVKQDVSMASNPAQTPDKRKQSIFTTPLPNLQARAQTSSGLIEHTSTINRRDMNSGLLNRSSAGMDFAPYYKELEDSYTSDMLVDDSESMKTLAEFLMTKDPPPNNWISGNVVDEKSTYTIKKPAFMVFGKHKRRKSQQIKLLQLPDSAVSAKTRNGTRHIAISIPIEHDCPQVLKSQIRRPQRSQSQPNLLDKLERSDTRAVVVLKPVVEAREPLFSNPPSQDRQSLSTPPRAIIGRQYSIDTPPTEVLDIETTKTLQNYYTQLNYQQRRLKMDGASNTKPEPPRTPRSYVAVSSDKIRRPSSLGSGSDPRHSGGTTYSATSIASVALRHSRAPSSVSTVPSSVPMFDLPKRQSSLSKPQTPVVALPIAKTLKETRTMNGDTQLARGTTPSQPGPPPTTSLPDIPSGYESNHSRPSTAPHFRTLSSTSQVSQTRSKRSISVRDGPVLVQIKRSTPASIIVAHSKQSSCVKLVVETSHPEQFTSVGDIAKPESSAKSVPETRQEKVKALRQRDVAAARKTATSLTPLIRLPASPSELLEIAPQNRLPPAPPRNPKRRSLSTDRLRRRAANTLTPILLVADLQPTSYVVSSSDVTSSYPSPRSSLSSKESASARKEAKNSSPTTTLRPRSMTSSYNSNDDGNDSDTIPPTSVAHFKHRRPRYSTSMASLTPSVTGSATDSVLERRRGERRANRNVIARDRTYEERLCKLERENQMLMNTLAGIVGNFGGLINNETSDTASEKWVRSGSTGCL